VLLFSGEMEKCEVSTRRERERERELASYLRIVRCVEREYEGLLLDGESFCTGFLVLIFVFGDGFW